MEGWLRSILGLFSSFRATYRSDGMGWMGLVIIGHRSSKSTFGANIPLEFTLLAQKLQLTISKMDNSQLLASISTQNTGFSKHIYISSDKRLDIRTMMEKHSCIWFMLGFTTLYQVPFWLLRLEPNQIFQFKLNDCFKIWVNSFSDREKDKSCYFRWWRLIDSKYV